MDTCEVVIPATKKISIDGQRYEVAADTPVPVIDAAPLPQQKNRHMKFTCPVCGCTGRSAEKYRAKFSGAVCSVGHEENPAFFEFEVVEAEGE